MLVKKLSFRVNQVEINESGLEVQKGLESILNEYKVNNYFNKLYNGYSDKEIEENKVFVTEYQGQEFRGYIEECKYEGRKNYKVYIKDYKEDCFHVGYVPFNKVPEIEEWIDNNNLSIKGSVFILGGNVKYCDNNGNLINERKEYDLEVELRFYNNKKTAKINKFLNSAKNKIFLSVFSIIFLIGLILSVILSKPKFEIKDFTISEKTYEYSYIDDTKTFSGECTVSCNDKNNNYIVLVNCKLVSGGNKKDEEKTTQQAVLINKGKGILTTYDSGNENEIEKPNYEFEVLGYIKFK